MPPAPPHPPPAVLRALLLWLVLDPTGAGLEANAPAFRPPPAGGAGPPPGGEEALWRLQLPELRHPLLQALLMLDAEAALGVLAEALLPLANGRAPPGGGGGGRRAPRPAGLRPGPSPTASPAG